jgi:hypothetical protein
VKTDTNETGESFEFIEVTLEDIAVANRLAHEVLGRSLDELAPQTRRLLGKLDEMVRELAAENKVRRSAVRFTRRQVRAYTGWGQTQLRVHLARLLELEYLVAHHGRRGCTYDYEVLYDGRGQDGAPVLAGLIDVDQLRSRHCDDANLAGSEGQLAGPQTELAGASRPQSGPIAGGSRGPETAAKDRDGNGLPPSDGETPQKGTSGDGPLDGPTVTVPRTSNS